MAILRKKEELDGLDVYHIPNEVMHYIASNVNKLIALHKLKKQPINIMLASEALKDIVSPNENRQITPELILEIVSEHYEVSISDLQSGKRNSNIAIPRQVAMYLCRSMTDTPLKSIGIILGGRDHSTVSHGVEKVAEELKTDEAFNNTVEIIKKKINPI